LPSENALPKDRKKNWVFFFTMSCAGQRPVVTARAGACTWSCGNGLWAENTRGLSPRPAAAGTGTEEGQRAEEPAPVPVGATGHRTQRPRDQVGDPPDHSSTQSNPAPHCSLDPQGGERWPIPPPLAPLIAQLVCPLLVLPTTSCWLRPAGCWLLAAGCCGCWYCCWLLGAGGRRGGAGRCGAVLS
jgi:hypothetical protein